jgi:glycosyltransferase involved in cell wall biosynthesis
VYPSLFEGFGIPILEAYSFGKTVATSNISSMPEVGGDAAVYFNPLVKEEIADGINSLLDQGVRKGYEEKVENRLKSFESSTLIQAYVDIYDSI